MDTSCDEDRSCIAWGRRHITRVLFELLEVRLGECSPEQALEVRPGQQVDIGDADTCMSHIVTALRIRRACDAVARGYLGRSLALNFHVHPSQFFQVLLDYGTGSRSWRCGGRFRLDGQPGRLPGSDPAWVLALAAHGCSASAQPCGTDAREATMCLRALGRNCVNGALLRQLKSCFVPVGTGSRPAGYWVDDMEKAAFRYCPMCSGYRAEVLRYEILRDDLARGYAAYQLLWRQRVEFTAFFRLLLRDRATGTEEWVDGGCVLRDSATCDY